jgi:hypothetical protein
MSVESLHGFRQDHHPRLISAEHKLLTTSGVLCVQNYNSLESKFAHCQKVAFATFVGDSIEAICSQNVRNVRDSGAITPLPQWPT